MRRTNGAGTVYRVKSRRYKPWRAVATLGWDKAGKQIRKHIGYYKTKLDGENALAEFNLYKDSYKEAPTVGQLYKTLLIEKQDRAKSTIDGLVFAWNYASIFEHDKITLIKSKHIKALIDEMVDDKKSYSSCYQVKSLMSQIYTIAERDDHVNKNYARLVELPKKPEPDNRTFSDESVSKFFEYAKTNDWAKVICILIYTCMRPGELLMANKYKVNLKSKTLIGGFKTEAGTDRIIPIHDKIIEFIKYFLQKSTSEYLITHNESNVSYWYFLDRYNETLDELDVENLTPHKCRKTGATLYRDAGVPPEFLQLILGHADYNTTVKYYFDNSRVDLQSVISLAK